MIVWLNGAFGVGKTSVASALVESLPTAVTFDPELIGGALCRVVKAPTGDYQDLRSWRLLVVAAAAALDGLRSGPLVVPMALQRERSTSEIIDALRARGRNVHHVLLDVTGEELRRRIARAPTRGAAEEGTRAWRRAHAAEYERERPRLAACADLVVDTTTRSPAEVAAAVLAHLPGWLRATAPVAQPAGGG